MYREKKNTEETREAIASAQRRLGDYLANGGLIHGAGSLVTNLAELEGKLQAYALADMILADRARFGRSTTTILRGALTDALLEGADDGWSGRGNDLARARFDGYRQAARNVLDSLDED